MSRRLRLSPAMVVALAALLVALGGTAVASVHDSTIDLQRPYGAFQVVRGKVTTLDSAGIAGVTRLGRGKFCVQPTSKFSQVTGVVSVAPDPVAAALAYVKLGNPDCPSGSLEVITGVLVRGSFRLKDETFYTNPEG